MKLVRIWMVGLKARVRQEALGVDLVKMAELGGRALRMGVLRMAELGGRALRMVLVKTAAGRVARLRSGRRSGVGTTSCGAGWGRAEMRRSFRRIFRRIFRSVFRRSSR